jgi:hypothetical protein
MDRAQAFQALQDQFRQGLAARWVQIHGAPDRAQRIAALHRLAGAAGGFGLAELDAAAREALALAERDADAGLQQVALERVHRAIDAAGRGPE